MKKCFVFLPIILALLMVSCNNGKDAYTPFVQCSMFLVNPLMHGDTIITSEDTLNVHSVNDYYVLDTISVSDTVVYAVRYCSLGNELVAARVSFDTTQLNMCARLSVVQSILLPSSDLRNLQLKINPGYNLVTIPYGYKPRTAGTHKFVITVESDSEYSPNSLTLFQPVRE